MIKMRKIKGKLVVPQGMYPKEHRIKANTAWGKINQRCYDQRCEKYKSYGARGIQASVGRIDHDKGYFLENMTIQSMSENSKEMHSRRNDYSAFTIAGSKNTRKKILVSDAKTKEPIMIFESLPEASKITGAHKSNISTVATRKGRSKTFKNGLYTAEYI